jgi:hypothetical protein
LSPFILFQRHEKLAENPRYIASVDLVDDKKVAVAAIGFCPSTE